MNDASQQKTVACPWCGRAFAAPRIVHGAPQKFCSPPHRAAFWKAARRWVANAVSCGLLTPDAIKAGGAAVYGSGPQAQGELEGKIEKLTAAVEDAIDTLEAMDLHTDNQLYDRLRATLEAFTAPQPDDATPPASRSAPGSDAPKEPDAPPFAGYDGGDWPTSRRRRQQA